MVMNKTIKNAMAELEEWLSDPSELGKKPAKIEYTNAFTDEDGVIGHFIMRYIHGNNKVLRFGWVIVDDSIRGKGYGTSMLRTGLYYAFNILGVHTVTIGVFEHNDIAHSCYKKVGFVDKEIVPHERDNIIEMAITKEDYLLLTKL